MNASKYRAALGVKLPRPTITATGCWIAPNKPRPDGYVDIRRNVNGVNEILRLHTLSWFIANGDSVDWDSLERAHVCHTCALAACYNPKHLYLGDARSNGVDTAQSGNHPHRRLTNAAVRELRAARASGATYPALSARFGISLAAAHNIVSGKTYWWLD